MKKGKKLKPLKLDYNSGGVPEDYKCSKCGLRGVKLWRQYQTFASCIELLCVDCALKDQNKHFDVKEDGTSSNIDGDTSSSIGWLVPAVPTGDNDTFWGHTSAPSSGCIWWYLLPLRTDSVGPTIEDLKKRLLRSAMYTDEIYRLWQIACENN